MNKEMQFYTTLAQHYDKIYQYVDYAGQADFFDLLIKSYSNIKCYSILDVCCGTGKHIEVLTKKGYKCCGIDLSFEMLAVAKERNPAVTFKNIDMRSISSYKNKHDVILCYFNSILYNKNMADLKKTLKGMYKTLSPGGILIFDAVDKAVGINSKPFEFNYTDEDISITFRPQWFYKKVDDCMDLEIDFIISSKNNTTHLKDSHLMGAFTRKTFKRTLEKIGFHVTALKKDYNRITKASKSDLQMIYVAVKK